MLYSILYRNLQQHGWNFHHLQIYLAVQIQLVVKIFSQGFLFQSHIRIHKLQFICQRYSQAIGQFQIPAYQFGQSNQILAFLLSFMKIHFTIQHIKNEMGRNPVSYILQSQGSYGILHTPLFPVTQPLPIQHDDRNDSYQQETSAHNHIQPLIELKYLILLFPNRNLLLHQGAILCILQFKFCCPHLHSFITNGVIYMMIFFQIVICTFIISHLLKITLQITITHVNHIRFYIIIFYSMFQSLSGQCHISLLQCQLHKLRIYAIQSCSMMNRIKESPTFLQIVRSRIRAIQHQENFSQIYHGQISLKSHIRILVYHFKRAAEIP